MRKTIRIKLIHSPAGRYPKQGKTVRGLGFKRLYEEKVVEDTPEIRGMVKKIPHLVAVIQGGE